MAVDMVGGSPLATARDEAKVKIMIFLIAELGDLQGRLGGPPIQGGGLVPNDSPGVIRGEFRATERFLRWVLDNL